MIDDGKKKLWEVDFELRVTTAGPFCHPTHVNFRIKDNADDYVSNKHKMDMEIWREADQNPAQRIVECLSKNVLWVSQQSSITQKGEQAYLNAMFRNDYGITDK